jgi:hypothetical protein
MGPNGSVGRAISPFLKGLFYIYIYIYIYIYFSAHNKSSRTMAAGFTQPITELSTGRYLGVKRSRRVRLTALPPSMNRFYRQCGFLNISQLYRPPRSVTGIALFFGFVLYSLCVMCPLLFVWLCVLCFVSALCIICVVCVFLWYYNKT